ncbi:unnamed protein product [Spirodela intermedia]|uniref:Carbohydrate kinase PfkB domain-containing protein n=1 Tax=Spirodela intermedia TaxID=51605 RepID=A0A7I8J766_SPIIN|nr:unnamed protein product [Spirodela intermedia]CAA6665243.1 unnamed protein product [Spirodela intermedia]
MGVEGDLPPPPPPPPPAPPAAPLILGLQPAAMVDHVARVDWSLLDRVPGDRGGSQQDIAGGSVANTIRGLTAGFRISCGIIGACGDDDQGRQFVGNMGRSGVDLSRLRMKKGPTGRSPPRLPPSQCACLVDIDGNRTMRPCLTHAVKLQAHELSREDFRNSKWLVVRYNSYNLESIHAAIRLGKQEGVSISMDLASFEMVRDFRTPLLSLLEGGLIDLCFANEDEAREVTSLSLSRHGDLNGPGWMMKSIFSSFRVSEESPRRTPRRRWRCIAKQGRKVVRVPAVEESQAVDATGAGDLFASGFLYGLVRGLPLEDCCKVGACTGGSVVRSLGGEVRPENWLWMYKQMLIKGLPLPSSVSHSFTV